MIRDEDLALYIDRESDAAQTRVIEAALGADPGLRARLERLQRGDRDVKAAFDVVLDGPIPDQLLQSVRASLSGQDAAAETGSVLAFRPREPRGRIAARWAWPASIAAALAVGVLVGRAPELPTASPGADWVSGPHAATPHAGAVIAAGLSRSPSGVAFALPGGRKATPVLTFASQSGDLCRQFDIVGSGARENGVACRSDRGAWRLVALTSEPAVAGRDYSTAAGPGNDPISALTDRLIRGEPLDAAQEAAALGGTSVRSGLPAR